jgi:hypothetical protein
VRAAGQEILEMSVVYDMCSLCSAECLKRYVATKIMLCNKGPSMLGPAQSMLSLQRRTVGEILTLIAVDLMFSSKRMSTDRRIKYLIHVLIINIQRNICSNVISDSKKFSLSTRAHTTQPLFANFSPSASLPAFP